MTPEPEIGRGEASARAALAGNPSDGYGGAVLAVALGAQRATATAVRGRGVVVEPEAELVRATVARFAAQLAPQARDVTVRWSTGIPRAVGLGGSSAIVIAVLRALGELFAVAPQLGGLAPPQQPPQNPQLGGLAPPQQPPQNPQLGGLAPPQQPPRNPGPAALAELALSIEVDDLGTAAGLQDRVAQAFGGVTFMDFSVTPPAYDALDPATLPPLVVAWRSESGGHSDAVHAPLRDRFERGEPVVVNGLRRLADHAHNAEQALRSGDRVGFARAVDGSFDARRSMLALDPRHVAMIDRARSAGAAANYTGSGGAIVAVCSDDAHQKRVTSALRSLSCETIGLF